MISTPKTTTGDAVVDFLSDQLKVQSRTLLRLVDIHGRSPYSVAPEQISAAAIRTQHTFALATAAAERSCCTIGSDSCFGQALIEYFQASGRAREALPDAA